MSQIVANLWKEAGMPLNALDHIQLDSPIAVPSTFRFAELAQGTIAASALAAAQLLAFRLEENMASVTTPSGDAVAEFRSERIATLDGQDVKIWDALVGMYKTEDGWLRPHTNWAHHRLGLLNMLDMPEETKKQQLAAKVSTARAHETAERAMKRGLVLTSLRSFAEWDATEQGRVSAADTGGPVKIERLEPRPPKALPPLKSRRPLEGVRVLDLTRVIAGPTAGRTLAAYGADVMWITASHLPSLPPLDADTSRGKLTTQLDLRPANLHHRAKFESLVRNADVLLQSYRPGALASLGYNLDALLKLNPDLVYATLSAYSEQGPWKDRKGFDSLVQFACGINEAEGRAWAEFSGESDVFEPRALPCQALDHGAGYLLAFGIQAALYRRANEGGAYKVEVSLLSTAKFLRSLGRHPPSAFASKMETRDELRERGQLDVIEKGWEGRRLEAVKHAAVIEGAELGARRVTTGYADIEAVWPDR